MTHFMGAMLGLILIAMSQNSFGAQDDWLSKLRSSDPRERLAASQEIVRQRAERISATENLLLEFISVPERKGTVGDIMSLLGDLRSEHSVPLLVKYLTFTVFYKDVKRPQPISDLYPAAGALIKIGMPAVDPLVASARETDDDDCLRVSGFVLRKILGDALVKTRINVEADNAVSDSVRRRISKLLVYASSE